MSSAKQKLTFDTDACYTLIHSIQGMFDLALKCDRNNESQLYRL